MNEMVKKHQKYFCITPLHSLPSGCSQVSDLHIEEGQEGVSTEGACRVQVGVVRRPAGHDFLVINQAVACLTAGTAGDQQLETDRRWSKHSAEPVFRK